ncbi:MAG: DNA polymerase III subunit beta [Bacteroidetes bacterium]|jgi:predicted nucleotidyltransferase|nr:DNA polymerase III subunit beta [Bacteroidota bacterium]
MSITAETLRTAVELARSYGATRVLLFGSALSDPANAQDLDLATDISGLDLFAYAGQLEERLGISVDVVPLTPRTPFTDHIAQTGEVLYDAALAR